MPKTYKDTFTERVNQEVAAWKAEDQKRLDLIENQTARVKELDAEIQRDLDSAEGATASTAANKMNVEHLEKQITEARHEIETHEPLYDYMRYGKMCEEIKKSYGEAVEKDLTKLSEKLHEAELILDDMQAIFHEAGECQQMLDRACAETGTDARKYERRTNLYTDIRGYTKEREARKTLHDLLYRLSL